MEISLRTENNRTKRENNKMMFPNEEGQCEGDAADEATIIDYSKTGANKR